jgi:tyrosyl-tRNA synthetase
MLNQDFVSVCKERGFLHQCTDEDGLRALMSAQTVPAYIGFDCTAPSLHVGSLVQIMMLRHLQKCGHKPIVLMGGGTTKIGDPSGKDEARKMLSDAQIQDNMDGIKKVFEKFLSFGDGPTDALMVNNDDWLKDINYVTFLRDYGRHFSVNRMIGMESVKQRLDRESHLSFLEFNYMIMQAYDFVELNERFGCRLQMGGSDQWGNIVTGTDLFRKKHWDDIGWKQTPDGSAAILKKGMLGEPSPDTIFGLTSPLITTASGAKMGKTAEGAVWLNFDAAQPDFSKSPYNYWQFWRNTEDADVARFLRLFTELPLDEIATLETLEGAHINDAKIRLANEATALLHGQAAAAEAEATARKVFEQGGVGDALPEILLPTAELASGIPAFKLLQEAGLAKSGKEARQKIREGAAKLNDATISDENQPITAADMQDGQIKLSVGKKRHALVKAT